MRADEEAKAASKREVINERTRMAQKRKRMAFLEERHRKGEIDLREDGTYTVLVSKKVKNGGKNGSSASVGAAATARRILDLRRVVVGAVRERGVWEMAQGEVFRHRRDDDAGSLGVRDERR